MKVSDIITYIMKIMGFDFKRFRSSIFRDIQKSAKSQDLEYSCTQTGVEKAGWFLDRKNKNTPNFPSIEI